MIDVCLVEVPYSSFASPVFSLSLLKGALHGSGLESQVVYGNMLFCRKVGLDHYLYGLSMTPQELMFGDMVFAAYAQGKPLNKSKIVPEKKSLLCGATLKHLRILLPEKLFKSFPFNKIIPS